MEAALEADDGGAARVGARELDRVLDRLGARVEEGRLRGAAERREREQPLGQLDVHLVRDHGEVGVQEARRLLLHGLDDVRVRVADVEDADAAREVDERVPVDVGDRSSRSCPRRRSGGAVTSGPATDALLALEDRPGASGPGISVFSVIARVTAMPSGYRRSQWPPPRT